MATIQEDKDPLDGLSKSALKSEVHWWHGRALEMEIKVEKLHNLVLTLYMCNEFLCEHCKHLNGNTCDFNSKSTLRNLGIMVD